MNEFPDKPVSAALGQPELDPPFTWRVHPDDQPMDLHARRVMRVPDRSDEPALMVWVVVSGSGTGYWHRHDEVAAWPYTSDTVAGAAVIVAAGRGPREGLVQPAERGDMDVDSFKGGGS